MKVLQLSGWLSERFPHPDNAARRRVAMIMADELPAGELEALTARVASLGRYELRIETPDLLHTLGSRPMAGIALCLPPELNRPLLLIDTQIHDTPTVSQRAETLTLALKAADKLGIKRPKAALLAAVEVPTPGLQATMDAAELSALFAKTPDAAVQGPLSMDLAVNEQAARKKKASGEVPGHADLLSAPSHSVARGVRDAWRSGCGLAVAEAVIGGEFPIAIAPRGTGVEGAFLSFLLAVAVADPVT